MIPLLAGCSCGNSPAEGAARVVVLFEDFRPGCVEVMATDAVPTGQSDFVRLEGGFVTGTKATVAVYPKPGWSGQLELRVRSYEGNCAGTLIEELRRGEPLKLVPGGVVEWVARLRAVDSDDDGFAAQGPGVSGSDCNDASSLQHPGATEACGGAADLDCDGQVGCADSDCVGRACDDGQPCTTNDVCLAAGTCAGALVVCETPSDQCERMDGRCADDGGCAYPVEVGRACDAGVAASSAACRSDGTCAPGEADCSDGLDNDGDGKKDCADSDCITQSCDDGIPCTHSDRCTSTSATGCVGTPLVCATPPAGPCFRDAGFCDAGQCVYLGAQGRSCQDGNACTLSDTCTAAAVCSPGTQKVCNVPVEPQCQVNPGTCEVGDGGCGYTPKSGPCTDGNACTYAEACAGGQCTGGVAYTCPPAGECFDAGTCQGDGGCRSNVRLGATCTSGLCLADGGCSNLGAYPYPPTGFNPGEHPPAGQVTLNCQAVFDSSTNAFTTWCGVQPAVKVINPSGQGEVSVLSMSGLTIADGGSLALTGSRPVILAVHGEAYVAGGIFAHSSRAGARSGPGADAPTCGAREGKPGTRTSAGGGGGGGGFLMAGAKGGGGNGSTTNHGVGGADGGADPIVLRGGCPGGMGGPGDAPAQAEAGVGGGAVQLSVAGTLVVQGAITASGAGGAGGDATNNNDPGGAGGGSGGMVFLEANLLTLAGTCRLTANGGAGGGGADASPATAGDDGSIVDGNVAGGGAKQGGGSGNGGAGGASSSAPVVGETASSKGGGGGGGAAGFIYLRSVAAACSDGATAISPPAVRYNCP